jgi:hypothetical protein
MNTAIYRRQWDVGSFTDPTKKPYKVSERLNGGWECSCPAWTRHTPRADCKHIDRIKRVLRTTPDNAILTLTPPPTLATLQPNQRPTIVIDGYTIRRHALVDHIDVERFDEDTLINTDTNAPTVTRGRREL